MTLEQRWKASRVGRMETNYACRLGSAKGENRLPGKTAPRQAFPLHFSNHLLVSQQTVKALSRDINDENVLTLVVGKVKKQTHKGYNLSGMVGAVTWGGDFRICADTWLGTAISSAIATVLYMCESMIHLRQHPKRPEEGKISLGVPGGCEVARRARWELNSSLSKEQFLSHLSRLLLS